MIQLIDPREEALLLLYPVSSYLKQFLSRTMYVLALFPPFTRCKSLAHFLHLFLPWYARGPTLICSIILGSFPQAIFSQERPVS